MRCQALLLSLLVVCSLGIAGYIHNKRKEELKLAKHVSFQNVKHKVTGDVLKEYTAQVMESTSLLDQTQKQIQDLEAEVAKAQEVADAKKAEADTCTGDLKLITDEAAALETEKTNSEGVFQKKKTGLQEQIANLKKEAEERSKVCDYIRKDSPEGRKLCKIEDPAESVKEEVKEGPKEEVKEGPKEEVKEGPKEEVKEGPKEEVKEGQKEEGPKEEAPKSA